MPQTQHVPHNASSGDDAATAGEGILAHDVTVTYRNGHTALHDASFGIPRGTITALVGVNGAGKSTLFKAIMGFVPAARGEIRLLGRTVKQALSENLVAYVPQSEEVDWAFPVLVEDVVMMGRYGHMGFLRRPKQVDHEAVTESLARVGMTDFRERQIGELSGGQRKRVFLARALAQDGRVILLDEPFTGVDVNTEEQIVALLRELRDEGRVMLVSTHNLGSVPEFCDRTVLMSKGTVLAHGTTEETFTSANLEVAFGGVLRHFTLGGNTLHDDDDPREVSIITDDERPFVHYGERVPVEAEPELEPASTAVPGTPGGAASSDAGAERGRTVIATLLEPFGYGYMFNAMWVSSLVGAVCAFLSAYLMLKGWSLIGDALSHAVVPGVAGAYILGLPFALGAFVAGGLAAGAMLFLSGRSGLKIDVIIGIIFTSFFGLGLFMVSLNPMSVSIQTIIMGNILAITPGDTLQLAIIGFVSLGILLLKWKDLMVTFFDENHARSIGLRPDLLRAMFFVLLSAAIVAAMVTVGAFLVIALVVTPGATAYLLCDRFERLLVVSVLIGAITSFVGAYASYFLDGATGGIIVMLQTIVFLTAFVFAPKHGMRAARRKAADALSVRRSAGPGGAAGPGGGAPVEPSTGQRLDTAERAR